MIINKILLKNFNSAILLKNNKNSTLNNLNLIIKKRFISTSIHKKNFLKLNDRINNIKNLNKNKNICSPTVNSTVKSEVKPLGLNQQKEKNLSSSIANNSINNNNKKITIAHYPYANQLINKNGLLKLKGQTLQIQDPNNSEQMIKGILPLSALKKELQIKNKKISNLNRVSKYMKFMQTINLDIALYKNISYNFYMDTKKSLSNVQILLKYFFRRLFSYISNPIFIITPNKVIIKLFYYKLLNNRLRSNVARRLKGKKYFRVLFSLAEILSGFFKKPVELIFIRVYRVFDDSQILADSMGILSFKKKMRFRRITNIALSDIKFIRKPAIIKNKALIANAANFPVSAKVNKFDDKMDYSYLSGLSVKLGGRLMSQKVIPRKSVENKIRGSLSRAKADYVSTGRFTGKSKRGAFSISVKLGYICI